MNSVKEIKEAVLQSIREVMHKDGLPLGDGDSFNDHGIDSLDQMSIMVAIEGKLGVELGEMDPKNIRCVNDYVAVIQKASNAGS